MIWLRLCRAVFLRGYPFLRSVSMSFAALNLLFPVVVAVHNLDEYRGYTDFVRSYPLWLAERTGQAEAS